MKLFHTDEVVDQLATMGHNGRIKVTPIYRSRWVNNGRKYGRIEKRVE